MRLFYPYVRMEELGVRFSPTLPPLLGVLMAGILTRTLQPIQPAAMPTWEHPVRMLGYQEG